jgi:hypothetical protein
MSECPYGIPAEKVVHKVAEALGPALQTRLAFIVSEEADGKLHSMHGPAELQKDMVHVCVGGLAPDKQLAFVVRHNESKQEWQAVAKEMGLDGAAINQCVTDGAAERILREQLAETTKLNITASPTLHINGRAYQGATNSRELFDAVCEAMGAGKPAVCANPPDAISRTDGAASGSCGGKAGLPPLPPEMVDSTPFTHTVVYAADALDQSRMDDVLAQTLQLYPKAKVVKVEARSAEGQKLIKQYGLAELPAYIFPADIMARKNIQHMQRLLQKAGDGYILSPHVGGTYFLSRPRQAKTIDAFFTAFSPKALRLLLDLQDELARPELKALGLKINLRPFALVENGQIAAAGGPPEVEEMLRELAVQEVAPPKLWDYLRARAENPASSWWEDYVTKAGLDPAAIKRAANGDKTAKELADNSNLALDLGISDEIAFLIENREVARFADKEALKTALLKLRK